MARKPLPSRARLDQLLSYDAETGCLRWKRRPAGMFRAARYAATWNTRFAGAEAGTKSAEGYVNIQLGNVSFRAHLVAWVLAGFALPPGDLDHINGDRADNRLSNLRPVSRSGNARNMARSSLNKSGVIGVGWNKAAKKWQARIGDISGRRVSLGYFDSIEAAAAARKAAEKDFGYHENHGR